VEARELLASGGAVLAAFFAGALCIRAAGASPLAAYAALLGGSLGSLNALGETGARMAPLLLAGLGVALAFRAGAFNIGAEGQLYVGALLVTVAALALRGLPGAAMLPVLAAAGFAGGALWGGIAGWLKARFGANEIINTIMLNFVAIYLVGLLLHGPLQEAERFFPRSDELPAAAHLPVLLPRTRLHAGLLLALLAAAALAYLYRRTVLGYELEVVGHQPEAARYARIPVEGHVTLAMALSGGLAGLAGLTEVAGIHHQLLETISANLGYTAIAVALLGRAQPLGIVLAAFLFAALEIGSSAMQSRERVPANMVLVIQGLIVLFVVARTFLAERFRLRRGGGEPATSAVAVAGAAAGGARE
jgi:simple sugar transport system permease protein